MGNDLFAEHLQRFKEKENPEAVLLVADDPESIKIIVAWTTLDVSSVNERSPLSGQSDREMWDWLWANARYSLADLAEMSSLSLPFVQRRLKPLISNRVLYPDGTVNSFVQRYLRERVLKLFDTKSRKLARGT